MNPLVFGQAQPFPRHSNLSTMSSAASVQSEGFSSRGHSMAYKVRNLAIQHRPQVDIVLDCAHGPHGEYVTSFSTMDTIKGTVSITALQDTVFDDIDISFVGVTRTHVDRLTTAPSITGGRTEATHRFLKLTQPIDHTSLPHPRIFSAERTYSFPFTFVVPEQLLPRACSHKVANNTVRDAHLQLPPSMGDAEVAGFGGKLLDDMAPEMCKIVYAIKVKAVQYRHSDEEELVVLDRVKKIRIKPAFDELPPLNVEKWDDEYRLRQEKTIRKNLFKSKTGTLIMETSQPKSLQIPGARTDDVQEPITTMTKVLLRFDPADEDAQPPRLGSLSTKLKILNFFATSPRSNLPRKNTLAHDLTQGYYALNIPLSSRCIASAAWTKHESEDTSLLRRDSGASVSSGERAALTGIPEASEKYAGKFFYTAAILVPITLPNNKNFLPTFHSCLISRQYVLSLSLSTSGIGMAMSLKVPVQVSADASVVARQAMEQQRQIMQAADDVEAVFRPRRVSAPLEEFMIMADVATANSDEEMPPSYQPYGVPATAIPDMMRVVG